MGDAKTAGDRVHALVMSINTVEFDPDEFLLNLRELPDDELARLGAMLRDPEGEQ